MCLPLFLYVDFKSSFEMLMVLQTLYHIYIGKPDTWMNDSVY